MNNHTNQSRNFLPSTAEFTWIFIITFQLVRCHPTTDTCGWAFGPDVTWDGNSEDFSGLPTKRFSFEYQKDVRNFWKFEGFGPHLFFLHHWIISVWVLQALSDWCLFTLFLTSQEVYQQDWGHRGTKVGSMADVKRSPTLRPIEDFVSMLTKHLKHLEIHDPASPMEMLIVLSVPWWSSTSKHTSNFKKLVFVIQLPFSLPGNDFGSEWYHFRNKKTHLPPMDPTFVPSQGIFGLSHKQLLGSEWVENDSLTVKFELEVRPDDWHLGRFFNDWFWCHGFG